MKMMYSVFSIVVFLITCKTAFSAKDCPILYHGIKDHSACVATSSEYESGEISEDDKKVILDEHNKVRAGVDPPACDMMKLYWNDDLAYVAQSWAKNCQFDHDNGYRRSIPGSFMTGQNLAKGYSTWAGAIKGWADEVKDFTFDGDNDLNKVGHYTQVVSGGSATIGCGFAKCKGFKLYVCNYGPGENNLKTPYTKCTTKSPLKDCKGKFCKNGGSMKKDLCECTCESWNHIYGDDCSTNCSVKDSFPCGKAFDAPKCPVYANVPPHCPWLCNTCPYLDGSGPDGSGSDKTSHKPTEPSVTDTPTSTTDSSAGAVDFTYSLMTILLMMVASISNSICQ